MLIKPPLELRGMLREIKHALAHTGSPPVALADLLLDAFCTVRTRLKGG